MKFVKGIGLFFVYPLVMAGLGFYAGVCLTHFFYPGEQVQKPEQRRVSEEISVTRKDNMEDDFSAEAEELTLEVSMSGETLCVETEYVLEERDVERESTVETTWRLPDKYVGMNREQFLDAMELYEAFPPLSEMERGFVSLEVLSFSRERVVVQMNYRYVQPSKSFYLAVYNNEVIVYLEDRKTVYIETDIMLEQLPTKLQEDIIDTLWLESEEELYNFLETYSS